MAGTFNRNIKNKFIEEMIADVSSTSSNYYITFGKYFSWPDDTTPPAANASVNESHYEVNRNILFGKKLSATDLAYVVKKKQWTYGKVYDYYSHTDPNLYNKDFYVVTSTNFVFKCLFNNYGAAATDEPTLTSTARDKNVVTTDGYIWKYLFSINSADYNKFATADYIPVIPNSTVTSSAVDGAIQVIVLNNHGTNYLTSNGSIDATLDTTNTKFKISNTGASTISGAYNQSVFYIYSGTGTGQYSTISNHVSNSSGIYIFLDTAITTPDSTSLYLISPQVKIEGDGINAFAISHVTPNTGIIDTIEVKKWGRNYTYANVTIVANTLFGSGATANAVISPKGGHGSDVVSELGTNILGISLNTTPSDDFMNWIEYRQIALAYNPQAAANNSNYQESTFNQILNFNILIPPTTSFTIGETVTGISSKATATVAYSNLTSIYVLSDSGIFKPYETLVSSSGKTCTISTINNKDLIPYSSEIFYYKNIVPVSRSTVSSEEVKLYFNF